LRQRLELFRAICRAVSHAHQHLIVHRDLKPGNILVTEDLRPKLLDFGIAKALAGANVEPCDWTVDRSPMTPHYASPEQHSGAPVTTATDVYALGVLLGELLTGEAASGSPPEATALATVPTDLEAVLHKATAERPEDRYPSAEQLGEEIGRFLDGAPVLAHPPTLAYRVRRFAGRHRWPLTAAALVFLLVSSAALGLAVLAGELAQQRDRARLEARTSQQVTDFLVDLFAQSEPGNRGEREPSASEMLQRGSERIAQSFDHSPADLPVQAALLGAIGRAYQALSRFDDAAPMLDRAVKLQRAADNPAGSSEALLQLAEVEHQRSDNERAELLAHEALSGLAELQAGAAPLQARAHRILGAAATQRGDLDAAERWLSAALAAHQELFGGSSEAVGRDQSALAALAFERRDSAAAETHASAAVEAFQSALGPDHPQVLSALTSLTVALQNQAKLDRVIATYQDLLRRQRRVFGDQHETVAITLNDLGTTYYDLEDFQAAEGELRSSLEILYALGSEGTLSDAEISKNLARTLWEAGRQSEAIEQYRRVLEIFRQRVENTSPSLGAPLTFLGGALCSVGDVQEGEALLEEAREIYLASLGPEHYRLALLDGTRAKCRLQGNDPREARRLLESARARASEHFGADHRIVRKMLALMAEIPPDIEHDASGH
ncbi:MAG: tetratricopeptide repeat protein, partial [Acidobacteriota bacterium]